MAWKGDDPGQAQQKTGKQAAETCLRPGERLVRQEEVGKLSW